MSDETLGNFEIHSLQILDEHGNCDEALKPDISDDELKHLHWQMVLARVFDRKLLNLQRSGRLGTLASSEGQEACQIPAMAHLKKDDWVCITFRENPALLARGIPMSKIMQYWGGDERGNQFDGEVNTIMPVSIPIASQMLHAVGIGMASNILKKNQVAISYNGDGATSQGDFHEALNYAADFNAPVVFICQNNQYAISLSWHKQTKTSTIAQKGLAYDIPSLRVDGNDIFAVYKAVGDAVKRAREGKGPTFIECFTYRMGHHTTSDDAHKYRDDKEVEEWRNKDPIARVRTYMMNKGIWDEEQDKATWEAAQAEVEKAVVEFEAITPQEPADMFKYMYKEMPWHLVEQQEILRKHLEKNGG